MERKYIYHKTVGLNNYERNYFKKHFGTNLTRLYLFRKSIAKEESNGYYIGTFKHFMAKGGKPKSILLSRKKVDAYIREVNGYN